MDLDKEREKKQAYLCKEVIDKNYDPNEFENFCKEVIMNSSLGGEGYVDIDKWDYLELKLIVKNFQKVSKTLDQQKQQAEIQQSAQYEENYTYYQQQNQLQTQYQQFQEEEEEQEDQKQNQQIKETNEVLVEQIQRQSEQPLQGEEEQRCVDDKSSYIQQHDDTDNVQKEQIQEDVTIKQNGNPQSENQQESQQEHHEQEEDLFEKFDKRQAERLVNGDIGEGEIRERSQTDLAFENFQKNLVAIPNNDFSSNIWQMPDFSSNTKRNSFAQNNQIEQMQGQDPFQYVGFDSFDKQSSSASRQEKLEQIRKRTISKTDNIQQQVQIANDKDRVDEEGQKRKTASSIDNSNANEMREKKSSSVASDSSKDRTASIDSSQMQEIEFQKQMDEFKANDFKTLKQLNIYNGGLQPDVIESNSVVKIQCKKLGQSMLSTKQQVNVYIPNTKSIQSGLFGSVTNYYVIQTKPFGWEVSRKFEDFQWLQNILVKMYPGVVIPKLIQNKKIKTEKHEKNRKSFLEHFLNLLVSNKDIKNSKFIFDFLYIADEKIFKEKQKESDKFPKPKNLAYILNHDGFVRLDYSKLENKAVDDALHSYLDVNEGYYKRLKTLSKDLMSQFQQVSGTLFQIGQIFTNLHQNTLHFKQSVPTHNIQFDAIIDTYKIMNNVNMMQGNSVRDQIKIIENHYYHFFKFQQENNHSIKTLSKLKTGMQDEYVKRINSKNVLSSLKKTFSSSNANETIDQPSKEQEVLKDQIAFYTYQLDKQISSFLNDKSRSYADEFGMYSNISQCFQSEMKIFWQDVLKTFEQVKQVSAGKKITPLKLDMMKKIS